MRETLLELTQTMASSATSQEPRVGPRPFALARLGTTLVALVSVLTGEVLIACRLRRPPEGWRRTLGVLLRSESTRFALSAFGLRIPASADTSSDAAAVQSQLASALCSYLADQPDARFSLEWDDAVTIRRPTASVDVVRLDFDRRGELVGLEPHLSDAGAVAPPDAHRTLAHRAVIAAYNRARLLREIERSRALRRAVLEACSSAGEHSAAVETYARRLLSSCCVSLETVDLSDPIQRFRPPDFRARGRLV